MDEARRISNQEYLIAALTGEIDDGGASREAVVHYNLSCPYRISDPRAFCFGNAALVGDRKVCVDCKEHWLESEVDE